MLKSIRKKMRSKPLVIIILILMVTSIFSAGTALSREADFTFNLNINNPVKNWEKSTVVSTPHIGSPDELTICNDRIYGRSTDGGILAMDLSGNKLWEFEVENDNEIPPSNKMIEISAQEEQVYFGQNRKVYSLDKDGNKLWEYDVSGYQNNDDINPITIESTDNRVFVSYTYYNWTKEEKVDDDSWISENLYVLNSNGELLWNKSGISGSISVYEEGNIFVNKYDKLFSILPNGTVEWNITLPDTTDIHVGTVYPDDKPTLSKDGIYVVKGDMLFNINYDGDIVWEYELNTASPPVSTDEMGNIYAIAAYGYSSEKYLICLSNQGNLRWKYNLGTTQDDSFIYKPLIRSESIVVGFYDTIYCVSTDGDIVWDYTFEEVGLTDGLIEAPPVDGKENRIYVKSYGRIISIGEGSALDKYLDLYLLSGVILAVLVVIYFYIRYRRNTEISPEEEFKLDKKDKDYL